MVTYSKLDIVDRDSLSTKPRQGVLQALHSKSRGAVKHLHVADQNPALSLDKVKRLKLEGTGFHLKMDIPAISAADESAESVRLQLERQEEAFERIQASFGDLAHTEYSLQRSMRRLLICQCERME